MRTCPLASRLRANAWTPSGVTPLGLIEAPHCDRLEPIDDVERKLLATAHRRLTCHSAHASKVPLRTLDLLLSGALLDEGGERLIKDLQALLEALRRRRVVDGQRAALETDHRIRADPVG